MSAETFLSSRISLPAGQKRSLASAILFMAMAAFALFPNFILAGALGPAWLIWIALATLLALFLSAEVGFCMLVICLFLQNLFIAIIMPWVPTLDQFTPMLGSSFINIALTAAFSAVLWLRLRPTLPEENGALLRSLLLFFVVIAIYTPLGIAHSTLTGALTYARVYMVGGMLLISGIAFGFQLNAAFTTNVLRALAFILGLWGFLEFFFTYGMYSLFHVDQYIHFKYASSTTTEVNNVQEAINFASRSYLNLSGSMGLNVDTLRPQGPNIHPISYAYGLSFGAILCYMYRYRFTCMMCLAILLIVGAKGPIIVAFVSIALAMLYMFTGSARMTLAALVACMVFYTVVGVVYGFYTEDYHVVGLMGGVKGFLSNPLGYGIGVGGNLSELADTKTDFGLFQGYGASFALESAFGVMIYQIGLSAIIFFMFYWRLWWNVWRAATHFASEPRLVVLPFALAILIVNSVFQEEALSPAGWGPLMLTAGLLLARYWQEDIFYRPALAPQPVGTMA